MGTRGAFGFFSGGNTIAMYNHYDSYPSGLGADIVKALGKVSDADTLRQNMTKISVISEDIPPTAEQIETCKAAGLADFSVSSRKETDWYCLLRNAQGEPSVWFEGRLPYVENNEQFLLDSLFCEYAYIINFDDGTLEVYKGFNKLRDAPGRYAALAKPGKYAGVRFVEAIPLAELLNGADDEKAIVARMERACGDESDD